MRLVVPDLISPSYFPAIAAVDLGLVRDEGVDIDLELRFPVTEAIGSLRSGEIEFLAGAAHVAFATAPGQPPVQLLAALSQGMYWFLVVRSDLGVARGDLAALRGLRIGAAPGPDLGLRQMLTAAGVDVVEAGIDIAPVPGTASDLSFGVAAAHALAENRIDAFWANGMGAEVAVRAGAGQVVVDARRGDGPAGAQAFTFPALMASRALIQDQPRVVAAVTRAVVRAQETLRRTPEAALAVGRRLFPDMESSLITELVRRDAPFYDPRISVRSASDLTAFAERAGLVIDPDGYDALVAESTRSLWNTGG